MNSYPPCFMLYWPSCIQSFVLRQEQPKVSSNSAGSWPVTAPHTSGALAVPGFPHDLTNSQLLPSLHALLCVNSLVLLHQVQAKVSSNSAELPQQLARHCPPLRGTLHWLLLASHKSFFHSAESFFQHKSFLHSAESFFHLS